MNLKHDDKNTGARLTLKQFIDNALGNCFYFFFFFFFPPETGIY